MTALTSEHLEDFNQAGGFFFPPTDLRAEMHPF